MTTVQSAGKLENIENSKTILCLKEKVTETKDDNTLLLVSRMLKRRDQPLLKDFYVQYVLFELMDPGAYRQLSRVEFNVFIFYYYSV